MEQGIRLPNPKADLEYRGLYIFQDMLGEKGQDSCQVLVLRTITLVQFEEPGDCASRPDQCGVSIGTARRYELISFPINITKVRI